MEDTLVINLVLNDEGVYVDENEVKSFGAKLLDKILNLANRLDFSGVSEFMLIAINMIASAGTIVIKLAVLAGIIGLIRRGLIR